MCEKIRFSDEDDLYILGDFIDRGDTPIPLLLDCMAEALHALWSIPVADCPFERTVADNLAHAEAARAVLDSVDAALLPEAVAAEYAALYAELGA